MIKEIYFVCSKIKEATLNVTLARQTLIELIQSYVNPQCIYTDHDVIKVENVEQHTMVHSSCKSKFLIYV